MLWRLAAADDDVLYVESARKYAKVKISTMNSHLLAIFPVHFPKKKYGDKHKIHTGGICAHIRLR